MGRIFFGVVNYLIAGLNIWLATNAYPHWTYGVWILAAIVWVIAGTTWISSGYLDLKLARLKREGEALRERHRQVVRQLTEQQRQRNENRHL